MCWRCRRVAHLCVCGLVRALVGAHPIPNRLGITVLQDRTEALRRPFGSAIVAELALEDCTSVWYDTSVPERVPRPPHLPLEGVGVLFPGPNATPLRRRSTRGVRVVRGGGDGDANAGGMFTGVVQRVDERVTGVGGGGGGDGDGGSEGDEVHAAPPPTHLVVLDTTWNKARRMYHRIPWVRELPAYVLGEHTPLLRSGGPASDDVGGGRGTDTGKNGESDDDSDLGVHPLDPGPGGEGAGGEDAGGGCVGAGPRRESGYRIRKQPKPGFLSTAECIAAALREAEPDPDWELGRDQSQDTADEDGEGDAYIGRDTQLCGEVEQGGRESPGERAASAVEACFDAMIEAQVQSVGARKNVRYKSGKA